MPGPMSQTLALYSIQLMSEAEEIIGGHAACHARRPDSGLVCWSLVKRGPANGSVSGSSRGPANSTYLQQFLWVPDPRGGGGPDVAKIARLKDHEP